ncbi:Dicer-like protein 2 [Toensbergia leucococca]|nr:Dicer-like protein 2 [Toensbergia leucococca]
MHLIRLAFVNGDFLAFMCMNFSVPEARAEIIKDEITKTFSSIETNVDRRIWCFMRHNWPAVTQAQRACHSRYKGLCAPIQSALQQCSSFPWALLTHLEAAKFFSNLIESLIGAIYIDSNGSMAACTDLLERLGMMGYLRRVVGE